MGNEYSEGGIRNKIIVGHKRIKIYLSNFIIIACVDILLYIIFVFVTLMVGTPLLSKANAVIKDFSKYLVDIFFLILAYSSIITFLGMLISNSTVVVLTIMIVALGSFIFGFFCYNEAIKLEYQYSVYQNEAGERVTEKYKNNSYPGNFAVKVYDKLLKINPLGQAFTITNDAVTITDGVEGYFWLGTIMTKEIDTSNFSIYSIADIIVFTALGLILFDRKELK